MTKIQKRDVILMKWFEDFYYKFSIHYGIIENQTRQRHMYVIEWKSSVKDVINKKKKQYTWNMKSYVLIIIFVFICAYWHLTQLPYHGEKYFVIHPIYVKYEIWCFNNNIYIYVYAYWHSTLLLVFVLLVFLVCLWCSSISL